MAASAMLYAPSLLLLLLLSSTLIQSKIPSVSTSGPWRSGLVTFYGGTDISGTMATDAACRYGNLNSQDYGVNTAALSSTALFNEPLSSGACYEIKCSDRPQRCHPGNSSILITATNFCHSNISPPQCNSPGPHFQLTMPTFRKIAQDPAVNVSVAFRRVPCQTKGGMTFNITGFGDKSLVLISNVAGAGNIVKGSRTGWLQMSRSCRNWRQYWQSNVNLTGQALSFRVTGSDRRTLPLDNIAPANWTFGQSFVGNNFRVYDRPPIKFTYTRRKRG